MPAAPSLDLTQEEVAAYVGDRHVYYWKQWQPVRGGRPRPSPNGAALIVGPIWLLYRKLYREFVFASLMLFAVEVALEAIGAPSVQAKTIRIFAFAAIAGLFGNSIYLRRARIVIAEVRDKESDLERRCELLRKRGGTSIVGPALLVALATLGFLHRRS